MNAIGFLMLFAVGMIAAKDIPTYNLKNGPKYFEAFIKEYNKQYDNEDEKAKRYDIFLKKLEEINLLNEHSEHAQFGINQFSDLTKEEFDNMYKGYKRGAGEAKCTEELKLTNHKNEEDSFDWRTKGAVTDVKFQGECGSCWAFSTIANVESVYAIKTGKQLDLSEQQLVDCDKVSKGCQGGQQLDALQYLVQYGSINEKDYPYVEKNQECKYNADKVAVNITGCTTFLVDEEDDVAEKLIGYAPLSIGITTDLLSSYSKGIISGKECEGTVINHAVLLVGYGTENGVPYWIVKNSWSTKWGEDGYFRMQRGVNCLSFTDDLLLTAVIN